MFTGLKGFDPILFLDMDITKFSAWELSKLRENLNEKLGEYILLKLYDRLTEDQFNKLSSSSNGENLINDLSQFVPDLENTVLKELDNFKAEFLNT